jgi:hypothetical protein
MRRLLSQLKGGVSVPDAGTAYRLGLRYGGRVEDGPHHTVRIRAGEPFALRVQDDSGAWLLRGVAVRQAGSGQVRLEVAVGDVEEEQWLVTGHGGMAMELGGRPIFCYTLSERRPLGTAVWLLG